MTAIFACGLAALFALLLLIGTPVGVTLLAVATFGMFVEGGALFTWSTLQSLPYGESASYGFVVVPMFLLMGTVAARAQIVGELYTAAFRWLAHVRGSLYIATTVTSTGFAALSGSTVVNAAVFTRIALPEMIALGFDRRFGAASIAAAGTIAAMIPPSLVMVIYGTVTDTSIGRLLIAGLVPGLLTAGIFCLGIFALCYLKPKLSPRIDQRFTLREKITALRGIWPLGLLVAAILGGIYSGTMPPTAAGAVGAVATVLLGLVRRRLGFGDILWALRDTVRITASLFIIILGGLAFARMLAVTGALTDLIGAIEAMSIPPAGIIALIVLFYLVLGMFVNSISMMVMTLPVVFPLVTGLGYDPVWFGIVVVKLAELGTITPPVGINLYAVASSGKDMIRVGDVMRGIWPFLIMEMIVLALLLAFPALVTGLVPANL